MIKIGFSTTNALISRVIRKITGSRCSHTFVVFTFAGRDWVVQADWIGVTLTTWESFQKKNVVVALVEIPDAYNVNLGQVLDTVGEPYDYAGLLGMSWVMIGRWLKRKWSNPTNSGKALFCSELATLLLQEAKYPGSDKLVASQTSPENLLEFLERK